MLTLSRPEANPQGVLETILVLGQLHGGLKDANSSRTIIVDAWARRHGVGVSADNNDVVLITELAVRDYCQKERS